MSFTVAQLKEIIKDLPDDMKVGSSGHYGEFLDCFDIQVMTVSTQLPFSRCAKTNTKIEILSICLEDAGPDPE